MQPNRKAEKIHTEMQPSPYMQNVGFPTEKDWRDHYPIRNVFRVTGNNKNINTIYLHHLIAIDKFNQETKITNVQLTAKDKVFFHFTPLHLAVLKVNHTAIEALLKYAKKNLKEEEFKNYINAADVKGWTALHFAALVSNDIYKTLKDQGADETCENKMKGTALQLKRLTGKETYNFSMQHSFLKMSDQQEKSFDQLTKDELQTLGIKQYRDFPLYRNPDVWKQLWQDNFSESLILVLATQAVKDLQKSPPQLVVMDCPEVKGKKLVAKCDIPKGKAIGILSGEVRYSKVDSEKFMDLFKPPISDELFYVWGNVTGDAISNSLRFANKGWPNTYQGTFIGIEGTRLNLLLAGEDIKDGDEIFWEYEPYNVTISYGHEVLFELEKIRASFAQGIDPLSKELFKTYRVYQEKRKNNSLTLEDLSNFMIADSKLFYPFSSPTLIMDLHFSETLSVRAWIDLLLHLYAKKRQENAYIYDKLDANLSRNKVIFSVIKRIESLSDYIKDSAGKKVIYSWFVEKLGKLTVMQLLKAMDLIKEKQVALINEVEKMDALLNEVENDIKEYDWRFDEKAPLSFDRRKEDFVEFLQLFCYNQETMHEKDIALALKPKNEEDEMLAYAFKVREQQAKDKIKV